MINSHFNYGKENNQTTCFSFFCQTKGLKYRKSMTIWKIFFLAIVSSKGEISLVCQAMLLGKKKLTANQFFNRLFYLWISPRISLRRSVNPPIISSVRPLVYQCIGRSTGLWLHYAFFLKNALFGCISPKRDSARNWLINKLVLRGSFLHHLPICPHHLSLICRIPSQDA